MKTKTQKLRKASAALKAKSRGLRGRSVAARGKSRLLRSVAMQRRMARVLRGGATRNKRQAAA
jgi:hypothetical protein